MFIAIVPSYNEEKRIGAVVQSLSSHVDEIIVVDDGSEDDTATVAKAHGATVLHHEINRGQGAALQTGHEYALAHGAEYVLHFDADGQFDVADILPALTKLTEEHADVILGSRFLEKFSTIPWFKRAILFPIGRTINRLWSGLHLTDVHNGFRILNRRALEAITITHDRMAHATEIPSVIKANNLRYLEYPVTVTYHEYGEGMRSGVKVVVDLLLGRFVK